MNIDVSLASEGVPLAPPIQSVESGGRLHRELSTFGVIVLTLSCISPVFSIFGVGADIVQHAGTGTAGLFLLGIGAAVVWAAVYAELGSAYPYAGGDYVGVGTILGSWAGFASLALWTITTGPAIAMEANIISVYVRDITSVVAPPFVTAISLAAAIAIAMLAVRKSAVMTGIFLSIEMIAVFVLIWAGLKEPARSFGSMLAHPVVMDGSGALVAASFGTLALSAVTVVFDSVGGNEAIGFGEELQNPHRNMGTAIVLSGIISALTIALPIICLLIGSKDLLSVLSSPAPFTEFLSSAIGPTAGRILSAAVALAIFNALIVQIMWSARLFFSLGRDNIFPRFINALLARVHRPSGAPRGATLVVGAFGGACCLLQTHVLIIFDQGLISFTLTLVCFAVLVGRRKGLTGRSGYWQSPLFPLAPVLGLILAACSCIAALLDREAGRPSILLMGAIVAAAVLWHHFVLRRRPGGWTPRLE